MRIVPAVAALLLALPAAAAQRFAVIAGNDQGSLGRPRLWFAEQDAERMAATVRELGDFPEENVVVLRGKSADELRATVAALDARIVKAKAAGERTLLFFYYSGHAGASGLEMGLSHLPYEQLRAVIGQSAADAKVAIVDACDAGRFTQTKGATFTATVDFALPADEVEGTAFIASSSAGEAAQESAAIGGSFFTHHFELGLRGAADADGDGQVTLAEAFRYTSVRTTSGTTGTEAGPQHPTYEIRMSGRGDVVLADLRRAESRLRLPADAAATFIVRGRNLFAEIPGSQEPRSLGLPAGRYTVERRAPEGFASAELELARSEDRALPRLLPTRYEQARQKGGPSPVIAFAGGGVAAVPLPGFGLAPSARAGLRKELGDFGLRFHAEIARGNVATSALRYTSWSASGGAALVSPLDAGRVFLEGGLLLGYALASQAVAGGGSHLASGPMAGGVLQATTRLGPVRVGLDLQVDARLFRLNDRAVVRPGTSLSLVALFNP